MNEETLQRIDALAAKLGVVGEHLWAVLLEQAYIAGVTATVASVFCILAAIALFVVAWAMFKDSTEWDMGGWVLALIAALLAGAFAIGFAHDAATCFLNPEYYALQKVLP